MNPKDSIKYQIDQLPPHGVHAIDKWLTDWDRLEKDLKDCFVIMPFSATKDYRNEAYWTHFFFNFLTPALERHGYRPRRSEANGNNLIRGIMDDLVCSHLVIAVLTDFNPNVWYELGVRHSHRSGTIMLCEEDQIKTLPADLKNQGILCYGQELNVSTLSDALIPFLGRAREEESDSPISDFLTPGMAFCINRAIGGRHEAIQIIRRYKNLGHSEEEILPKLRTLEESWRGRKKELQLSVVHTGERSNPVGERSNPVIVHRAHPDPENAEAGWKDYVMRSEDKKTPGQASSKSLYKHMLAARRGIQIAAIEGLPGRLSAIAFETYGDWLIVAESHIQTTELRS